MEAAESWEKLSDALLGPFEQQIIDGLTGAYRALEGRIETAYKQALEGAGDFPLQRLLVLRQQLEQQLKGLQLPLALQQSVDAALLDGQRSAYFWAMAELNKVKEQASTLSSDQAAALFADAITDPTTLLSPGMVQQNPAALIAAAQRQNALASYAVGGKGAQVFANLNRLVEVDLRGRIIGSVEFHLAQGDSWRQLRRTLQNSLALSTSRAQTVARTEMAAAMVEGSKLRYEADGIQQVQWQAVGSSRTCGYCAPRHGKVYRLREVVAPAHPNCRCTVTPWDPQWVELGLVDPEEEAKSRAAVLADLEAAGKQPISGPTPFERALGQEQAPDALWTPPRVGEPRPIPAATSEPFSLQTQVLPAGAQTSLVFKSQGGTGTIFEESWTQLEAVGGEVGENAKRMRLFVEKQQIVYNLGLPEKFANGERFADNQALLKSQRQALAVLEGQRDTDPKAAGPLSGARSLSEKLAKGETADLKYVMGKVGSAAGYTTRDTGIVNAYMTSQSKALDKKGIANVIASAEASLRQHNEYIDFYKRNYTAGVTPPKPSWSAGGMPDQSPDAWLSTLIHETGHQIHYRGASATKLGNKYKGLKGETYVSQYAHSKETEQFAEACVHFVLNPAGLKESHPRLYQWIDDTLKETMK